MVCFVSEDMLTFWRMCFGEAGQYIYLCSNKPRKLYSSCDVFTLYCACIYKCLTIVAQCCALFEVGDNNSQGYFVVFIMLFLFLPM